MKRSLGIGINLFVGCMSFAAWLFMAGNGDQSGILTAASFSSLKFFTVLSNLLNGAASLWYVFCGISGRSRGEGAKVLKLAGVSTVSLTFLTVALFLGPVFGYGSMYRGSNFWMHLVLPLCSVFSYLFLENGGSPARHSVRKVMLFTLLYEIGYVANLIVNGIGSWPETNDFYGFLTWGYAPAAVIAAAALLITWGAALFLRAGNRKLAK